MDYSVGSLADLITGSNTPNKPRVVQKVFKKEKHSPELSLNKGNSKMKKIKKKVDVNVLENSRAKKHKSLKKDGKVKSEDIDSEIITEHQPIKKKVDDLNVLENSRAKKHKSLKKDGKVISEDIDSEIITEHQPLKKSGTKKKQKLKQNGNNSSNTENVKEINGGKRKLEVIQTDPSFVDSNEESSPKKVKTHFQQNAERRVKKKNNEERKAAQDPEEVARTIFVGNVPIEIEKKKIKTHFKKYGKIETIRVRGIPVADPKTSKKTAAIKKEFNPKRSNVYCYVRFENKEDALKAEAENGALLEGHHLRVHSCVSNEKPDETKAIFVGNLSFDAVEDELWNLFEHCGPISYVRIIRDSYTGMGKGFAYVNFQDSDAVQLAIEMENVKLKDRELRISLSNLNVARKNAKFNKKNKIAQAGKQKSRKNFNKGPDGQSTDRQNGNNKQNGKTVEDNAEFQGAKFNDKRKKRKINKGLLEKKKLAKKIAPKSTPN